MSGWQLIKFCLGCILSLGLVGSQNATQMDRTILSVFQELHVTPKQFVLHHGGRTDNVWHRNEIDQLGNYFAHSFDISNPQKTTNKRSIEYRTTGTWQQDLTISIHVVNLAPQRTWSRPYLSIRLSGKGKPGKKFYQARQKLKSTLENVSVKAKLDFSIQGTKPAVRDGSRYVKKALQILDATKVEAVKSYPLISQSAFSPLMDRKIRTGGGWMNVQVASRIDQTHHQMIFTVGSPIITIEY